MKNIQEIESAENAAYAIFAASDKDFKIMFPKDGQDVAFEDDIKSSSAGKAAIIRLWTHPINKKFVYGIDGTIFHRYDSKRRFYPTLCESDLDRLNSRVPVPKEPIDYALDE